MNTNENPMNCPMPSISTAGWSFEEVLSSGRTFSPTKRISALSSPTELARAIKEFEATGRPLIIEGWHKHEKWPKDMFTLDFFVKHSATDIHVRNMHDWHDTQMPLKDFVSESRNAPPCVTPGEQARMYGKDAECPKQWAQWIKESSVIPETLHWGGSGDYFRFRPKNALVETLMCYLGVGDTFTPAHKDLCASTGQNLMCWTENNGSSYWFMTKGSDAPSASKFFHKLGQELDLEAHVLTLDELRNAPFRVYVAEQKLGDLVLVPPRSCHQVVNSGGMTVKTSWSRMTLAGLVAAYYHELPIYQRVCRPEIYRVKSTIFCALRRQIVQLKRAAKITPRPNVSDILDSVKTLLQVFREIIVQEISTEDYETLNKSIEGFHDEDTMIYRVVCDFCGGDIFQAYLECDECIGASGGSGGDGEKYAICPACYVDGRSCPCITMTPKQTYVIDDLFKFIKQAKSVVKIFEPNWKVQLLARHPVLQIFQAAIDICKTRRKFVCVIDKEETWGIRCKLCHASKCFGHMLRTHYMHSTEVIWYNYGSKSYHHRHQQGNAIYKKHVKDIYRSQKAGVRGPVEPGVAGERGPINMLRLHYALHYPTCFPRATNSVTGFYDSTVLESAEDDVIDDDGEGIPTPPLFLESPEPSRCPTPVKEEPRSSHEDEDLQPVASSSKDKLPTPQPEPVVHPTPEPCPPPTKRRQRQIMDYVLIPEAPYLRNEKGKQREDTVPGPSQLPSGTTNLTSPDSENVSNGLQVIQRRQKRSSPQSYQGNNNAQSITLPGPSRRHTRTSLLFVEPRENVGNALNPGEKSKSELKLRRRTQRLSTGMIITFDEPPSATNVDSQVDQPPVGPPSSSFASALDEVAGSSNDAGKKERKRKRNVYAQAQEGDASMSLVNAMNKAAAENAPHSKRSRKNAGSIPPSGVGATLASPHAVPRMGDFTPPRVTRQSTQTMAHTIVTLARNPAVRDELIANSESRARVDGSPGSTLTAGPGRKYVASRGGSTLHPSGNASTSEPQENHASRASHERRASSPNQETSDDDRGQPSTTPSLPRRTVPSRRPLADASKRPSPPPQNSSRQREVREEEQNVKGRRKPETNQRETIVLLSSWESESHSLGKAKSSH